ncbi:MAG: hypothetical protein ABFS56_33525 [Pseudomonadota bacterium]
MERRNNLIFRQRKNTNISSPLLNRFAHERKTETKPEYIYLLIAKTVEPLGIARLDNEEFIKHQGNFRYLRYVLPDMKIIGNA